MGGLTSLLLLLCVGVTLSAVLDLQKRIIGGGDCKPEERGYHVKLIIGKDILICGGSLLKNNWILTAAHCWEWGMKAVVGVHPGTKPVPVPVWIKEQPVIYMDDNKWIHDIMLLKLPSLPNLSKITPVDLPDCTKKPKPGETVQIAGHAATTTDPNNKRGCDESKVLRCANIKLTDCPKLRKIIADDGLPWYNHWLCGDTSDPKADASHGDSGGGVVVGNKIYGVISLTGDAEIAHAADLAFMDVCKYMKWIEATIVK